jgi:hypothetical protein
MYILICSILGFISFNTTFRSDLAMPTKCNALAARNAISVVIPIYSISNSFLFPSFSIISLHSVAAQAAFFARIRWSGRSLARLAGDSTKT